ANAGDGSLGSALIARADQDTTEAGTSKSRVLVTLAANMIVPVHKGAVRVIAPRPDMQFKKCGQVVAVGSVDQLEGLTFEDRRSVVVIRQPGLRVDDELSAYYVQRTSRPFVHQRLRM